MSVNSDKNKISVSAEELQKQKEFTALVSDIVKHRFEEAPKAFVHTYGCQGNVADGERLKGMLEQMGYVMTETLEDADLVLYNTCAIREHAEDRMYGNVDKLADDKPYPLYTFKVSKESEVLIFTNGYTHMYLDDPANEPLYNKDGFLEMSVSPIVAPDAPTYVTLDFEQGIPVALNGEKMSATEIVLALNKIGGANGIGLLDIVENRLVGIKCRGVYETPAGSILYAGHEYLESVTLDKMTARKKQEIAISYADLVYNGLWFSPLREALAAFVDKTQEMVTGKVRLKLYKGNMINAGVWSPYSLYSEEIATFGESD